MYQEDGLSGTGRAIDDPSNRAVRIQVVETRKVPKNTLNMVLIERTDIGRRIAPYALLRPHPVEIGP
jgi:hypothetical protein